jgi:hypothetical protein
VSLRKPTWPKKRASSNSEGVVTLVEEVVGTMESLIGFRKYIANMQEPTMLGTHDIVGEGRVTALSPQRMRSLDRRLKEIIAPLRWATG